MNGQDFEQLTLFPGDFPASRSVQPGSAEAVRTTVTSGRKCSGLLKSSGPLGCLAKTLLGSSTWRSTRCFLTWKAKATKQGRLYFQIAASVPRTSDTGSPLWRTPRANKVGGFSRPDFSPTLEQSVKLQEGFWPTPTARDSKGANSMEHLQREGKNNHVGQLANVVRLWPTPTSRNGTGPSQTDTRQGGMDLQTAAKLYPTPTTGVGLCGGTGNYQQLKALEADGTISGEERRSMAAGNGGQLNPEWVEALMGFPLGWTASEQDGRTEAGKLGSPGSPAASQSG